MAGKPKKTPKHIPQRTCVGCRTVLSKRLLIRVVCSGGKVQVDPSGKLDGRGAYLHDRRSCWEKGLKGVLSHALRTTLTTEDTQYLRQYMDTLPTDDETVTGQM